MSNAAEFEAKRLATLGSLRAVNSGSNAATDCAARIAADMLNCPIALVTLIDEDTQWFKARIGLDGCSTARDDSFCTLALELPPHEVMVVENALLDPRFADNPFVTGDPHVRFYAGALLTASDGANLGTLCVIDTVPRIRPSSTQIARLQDLARLVVSELERSRAERQRIEQQHMLNMAESMSGVGHWRFDLASRKIDWSDEVYAIHGVCRDTYDPNLAAAIDFYNPEDQPALKAALDATVAGAGPYELELRIRRADGMERLVISKGACEVGADGTPLTLYGVFTDITDQRAALQAVEQARQEAEAAAAVKSDFLANMSHELRTPLTSIIGFTGLAAEQPDMPSLARNYVQRVDNASRALLCTVNDILDFSKLEAGQVAIRPEPTDIVELCRATLDLFMPQAAAKDLDLRLDIAADAPTLLIDPDRIRQVLLNLVGNAVKFTAQGSVCLSVAWDRASSDLRIAVRDTGAGIAVDKADRLFKRFSQVDGSSTRSQGGTGLGLAICKGLVEAMGGRIGADSVVGSGSTFWFEMPALVASDNGDAAGVALGHTGLAGLRVLVADDHPANRELARLFLAGVGAEVTDAVDGETAVQLARRTRYDVILMDLRMPRMDGAEALSLIRAGTGPNRNTPVLAFTADAVEGESRRFRDQGFAGAVAKPVSSIALIEALIQVQTEAERAPGLRAA